MLSENVVTAILQSSVAGAGIVLAIYTLIVPISHRIFEERRAKLAEALNEFSARAKDLGASSPTRELDYLSGLMNTIRESKRLPKYISIGSFVAFLGYLISTFLSLFWVGDLGRIAADFWLPIIFAGTTFAFFIVGSITIKDTYSSLRKDYDETLTALRKSNGEVPDNAE